MTRIYEHPKTLQISLPDAPPPAVDGYAPAFVPFVRTGNLILLSGRLAKKNGKVWIGKLGVDLTTTQGKEATRGIATELIATLHAALGDLDNVIRIAKLLVLVNSARDFTEPHAVANGASELIVEVFGKRGAHARSAFGVATIPFGACVEIEMVVEAV